MHRVAYGHMQFVGGDHAQIRVTILPPELVADRCNCDRVAGQWCFLNDGNHSCCRHEHCDDNENGNDRPCQFHLVAAVHLGRFSAVVIRSLSALHVGGKQQGEECSEHCC